MQYSVGDKVKITDFYRANYANGNILSQEAIVKDVKQIKIKAQNLSKEDRAMYQSKFGIQETYILHELLIDINGHNFIVSDFGFEKC